MLGKIMILLSLGAAFGAPNAVAKEGKVSCLPNQRMYSGYDYVLEVSKTGDVELLRVDIYRLALTGHGLVLAIPSPEKTVYAQHQGEQVYTAQGFELVWHSSTEVETPVFYLQGSRRSKQGTCRAKSLADRFRETRVYANW